jgi:hypothetical protein
MTPTKAILPSEARNARRYVQAAGLIFYLLAVQGVVAFGVGLHVFLSGGSGRDLLLPAMGAVLAVCYVVIGFFLRRYRLWARNFAFAFAAVSLFAFPVGTVLGSLIVLFIERANRARVFPEPRRRVPRVIAPEPETPLLRFEPETSLLRFEPAAVSAAAADSAG